VVKTHPDYQVTALLRNVPADFSKRYPNVTIVKGDYDSTDIISKAASEAEVVVRTCSTPTLTREIETDCCADNGNSDHSASLEAIVSGLLSRSGPSFLIHLSGTGIIADWRDPTYLGKLNPKVWSDVDDIDSITSRPDGELHRHTDKFIQESADKHGDKLKTAIMCPPDIYGPGRGPGRTQSVYFPLFWKEIQKNESPFYAGKGTNSRSWVHIEDLMTVYMHVIEAAVAGGEGADWGREVQHLFHCR
jgi:nucleoside-diphosphate-sugar epimerase